MGQPALLVLLFFLILFHLLVTHNVEEELWGEQKPRESISNW